MDISSLNERFQNELAELRKFQPADLGGVSNIGAWPLLLRVLLLFLVFVLVVVLCWRFLVDGKLKELEKLQASEQQLRQEYSRKVGKVANLELLRAQVKEMEARFEAIRRQLPTETEVPGLLEDISEAGLDNGLDINLIDLRPEVPKEFYAELPINVQVAGGYHSLGSFVSAVVALPRIVTLHDFKITPKGREGTGGDFLSMDILARTYRYEDGGVSDSGPAGSAQR
jgi:type IV pilus assembly protein PilO